MALTVHSGKKFVSYSMVSKNQAQAFEKYCKELIALEIENLDGVTFHSYEMIDDITAGNSCNGTIEVSENTQHFVIDWFDVCGKFIKAAGQWTSNPFLEYDSFLVEMVNNAVDDLLDQSDTYNNMDAEKEYSFTYELNQEIENDIRDKNVSWLVY